MSFDPCCVHVEPVRVNTHAAPTVLLSRGPPISAVPPSLDNATLEPNRPLPLAPEPVSLEPCWVQVEPERVNTHAAPTPPLSERPPINAVFPSPDSATLQPNSPLPIAPEPVSLEPCWVQVEPERVNTHAAPTRPLSPGPPINAVFPSPDSATLEPKSALPLAPDPVSLEPCWVQVEPERVKTHAAPARSLSTGSPINAVFPSPDSATLQPNRPLPLPPDPVSLEPCWVQVEPERVYTHAAPVSSSVGPPISAVFPSRESATLHPNQPSPLSSEAVSFGPCWVQVEPGAHEHPCRSRRGGRAEKRQ